MKITKVCAGHSFKCKSRPGISGNFDMTEFSSWREAELTEDENPSVAISMLTMLCRADVEQAFKRSGVNYSTGIGPAGQDSCNTPKEYIQIGKERSFIIEAEMKLKTISSTPPVAGPDVGDGFK